MIAPDLTRRSFLRLVGGAGACLALGAFPSLAAAAEDKDKAVAFVPNAFIRVEPDGGIVVTITRSDMGQGVRTSLAMLVAEELDADWTKVRVVQASADPMYRGMGTGGSGSIRSMHEPLRQMGAGARLMLLGAAAKRWGVEPSACHTENGRVVNTATGKSLGYGELTGEATAIAIPEDVPLKKKADFKILGKATRRVDNANVVSGVAEYGIDAKTEGMTYAVISRRPAFGAGLVDFDDTEARKVPGVLEVVKVGNGVAIVATNTWAAMQGRKALKPNWNLGPNAELDDKKITDALKGAVIDHLEMPAGSKVIEATYDLPYLAHATLEPMNALADVREDKCTVWAGTQSPDGAQNQLARMLGLKLEQVTVNVCLLGGGFGRRGSNDYIMEAAEISKAVKKPVKLLWTRDDDLRNDNYRPACHHSLKGAVDSAGNPVGWSHQAIQASGRPSKTFGGSGMPYEVPGAQMLRSGVSMPIPIGAWRSVENSLLNVVNECFMDEMAHAAGQDPLAFRLKLIKNDRLRRVVEMAAKNANWEKPLPKGTGRGIACFAGYGSYAAHVVELTVKENKVRVNRIVAVVDCGMVINPRGVEAQLEGACTDGLSTALHASISIEKGAATASSYFDYVWMTIDQMPTIETHVIGDGDEPGGMGEVGYPSVAPAIANAFFAATGKRARRFPIKPEEAV